MSPHMTRTVTAPSATTPGSDERMFYVTFTTYFGMGVTLKCSLTKFEGPSGQYRIADAVQTLEVPDTMNGTSRKRKAVLRSALRTGKNCRQPLLDSVCMTWFSNIVSEGSTIVD